MVLEVLQILLSELEELIKLFFIDDLQNKQIILGLCELGVGLAS